MTKITLEIDNRIFSAEFPYNDVTCSELVEAFCSLLHGQTFVLKTIQKTLKETADGLASELNIQED